MPDPAARALASRRSNVIGVIIPSITNNVFSDVLTGIYDTIEGTPFDVQLGNSRYAESKEGTPARLSEPAARRSDRHRLRSEPGHARPARNGRLPLVQIMETGDNPVDMMVGFSHFDAAGAATRHLIEQGYRAPAFIGARMDPRSQRRFQGYRAAALAAGGFDPARCVTTEPPPNVSLGAKLFAELMAHAPETDAVLCNNDDLALGVLFEARRLGLSIPDRLGICGFNDLEMMACAEPPVTSVRTFRQQMGKQGSEMLLARLNGKSPANPLVNLGYELMVRRSTTR